MPRATSRAEACGALLEDGGVTAVLYEWNVATSKRWMNIVAPAARPVFGWNHEVVMRWAERASRTSSASPCWPAAEHAAGTLPLRRSV